MSCLGKGKRCDEPSRSSIQTKYVTQRSVVSIPQRSPYTMDYRSSSRHCFVPSRKYSVEFRAAFSASVLHSVNGYQYLPFMMLTDVFSGGNIFSFLSDRRAGFGIGGENRTPYVSLQNFILCVCDVFCISCMLESCAS